MGYKIVPKCWLLPSKHSSHYALNDLTYGRESQHRRFIGISIKWQRGCWPGLLYLLFFWILSGYLEHLSKLPRETTRQALRLKLHFKQRKADCRAYRHWMWDREHVGPGHLQSPKAGQEQLGMFVHSLKSGVTSGKCERLQRKHRPPRPPVSPATLVRLPPLAVSRFRLQASWGRDCPLVRCLHRARHSWVWVCG